jgi:hypothetical protein
MGLPVVWSNLPAFAANSPVNNCHPGGGWRRPLGALAFGAAGIIIPGWSDAVIFQQLAIIPFLLVAGSSLLVLVSQNWRRSILALSVQYLGVFWLIALSWPVELAVVKLVVGWVSGAVLGASQLPETDQDRGRRSSQIFRSLAAIFVFILAFTTYPFLATWINARPEILQGGLVLIGMGLLQLGMTTQSLRVVLGLLTVLSGFEIIYSAVETSVLVTGLLAGVTLGLALVGSYLLNVTSMDEPAEDIK